MTDDDRYDDRRLTELTERWPRLNVGLYRRMWEDCCRDTEAADRANDEAMFRALHIPAYHLLPVAWNRGDPLPDGFDPVTCRPF